MTSKVINFTVGHFFLKFYGGCGLFCFAKQVDDSITVIPLLNRYRSKKRSQILRNDMLPL